ncbi:MAG: hypothetical protein HZB79_02850 [Deltaproteobacteria bacterium]|nr:hypothetical protein [Deltaproteobacteria bacterium]
MKKRKLLLLASIIIFSLTSFCYALETDTHEIINENIAKNSFNGFSLDSYLKNQLGIQGGIGETVNSQYVWWWLKKGGEYEDKPYWYMSYLRSVNHFHNPIADNGYTGLWGTSILSGKSSTKWALLSKNTQSPGGYYSWYDARDYYLKALISTDKTTRDTNFAETFRGLGQVMHLIEDASVPAHTRDDGHLFYNYEKWVKNNPGAVTTAASSSIFFGGTISNIASFIDTDQYNGTNPSASNTIGLSEYTNANFFSEDTINASGFPYPDITQTTVTERTAPSGNYQRQYYLKNCCGETNGGNGYLLSAVDYLDYYRWMIGSTLSKISVLDDNVYNNYAQKLLPRAVGYSAGLLNYFFRGKIDMTKDPNNSSQYVIKNETNEYMTGTFNLYYDDTTDNRKLLTSWGRSINANDKSDPVAFTEPTDIKEKGKYILVFQGTLGSETGAVVGRVVSVEEGLWEDWEKGLTGKHSWVRSSGGILEVVDGFGDNTSKVLKDLDSYLSLQTSVKGPKKVSFDYYAKFTGIWDFSCIFLTLSDRSAKMTDEVWIVHSSWGIECKTWTNANGWKSRYCYYEVKYDKWVHVEIYLLSGFQEITDIWLGGYSDSEIYIDNIDFKY